MNQRLHLTNNAIARRLFNMAPALSTVFVLACAGASVWAGTPDRMRSAEAQYRSERTACLDGSSPQGRETCLKEAGAALSEARRGRLDGGESPEVLARNAVARCAAVLPDDRNDCERMARGEGEQSGSVAGGGVLRQIVTRTSGKATDSTARPEGDAPVVDKR